MEESIKVVFNDGLEINLSQKQWNQLQKHSTTIKNMDEDYNSLNSTRLGGGNNGFDSVLSTFNTGSKLIQLSICKNDFDSVLPLFNIDNENDKLTYIKQLNTKQLVGLAQCTNYLEITKLLKQTQDEIAQRCTQENYLDHSFLSTVNTLAQDIQNTIGQSLNEPKSALMTHNLNKHTPSITQRLTGHTGWINSIAFHPTDPTILASAGEDKAIILWDLKSYALLERLTGHSGPICSIVFHPTENILASAGDDKTIRLWQLFDPQIENDFTKCSLVQKIVIGALLKQKKDSIPNNSFLRRICESLPTSIKNALDKN